MNHFIPNTRPDIHLTAITVYAGEDEAEVTDCPIIGWNIPTDDDDDITDNSLWVGTPVCLEAFPRASEWFVALPDGKYLQPWSMVFATRDEAIAWAIAKIRKRLRIKHHQVNT